MKAKVRIIDISQLQSPDGGLRHDRLFSLAALYPQLERQPVAERQGFGTFLFDAANAKPIQVNSAPADWSEGSTLISQRMALLFGKRSG